MSATTAQLGLEGPRDVLARCGSRFSTGKGGTSCDTEDTLHVRQQQLGLLKWLCKRRLKSISVQLTAEQDGFAAQPCHNLHLRRGCSVPGISGKNKQLFAAPVPVLAKVTM